MGMQPSNDQVSGQTKTGVEETERERETVPGDRDTGLADELHSREPSRDASGQSSQDRLTVTPSAPARRLLSVNMSLAISALSLIVAATSAIFSYISTRDAYVSDRRSELIGYLAQLNDLYEEEGLQENEALTLFTTAEPIARTLTDVPATVYRQLGEALVRESPAYGDLALPVLDRAIGLAETGGEEYEQVAARRNKATIHEQQGRADLMRNEYRQAVEDSKTYKGDNLDRLHAVPAYTHVAWGLAEARARQCEAARRQLELAKEHAKAFTGAEVNAAVEGLGASADACFVMRAADQ